MNFIKEKENQLKQKTEAIGNRVGNTPLISLENVFHKPGVEIYAKLEWQQFGGSIKARPAYNIIREAVRACQLSPTRGLLDATSGNTGIAYASIGAALGIPVTLCLPANASVERKTILKSLGAELLLTSPLEGTDGAQIQARELAEAHPEKYFYADQYANENNWRAHYLSTGEEIFRQTQGRVTHFVAGLGTSGTFRGTTTWLKEHKPSLKAVALHPDSPMHGLEGWKHMETAIVPRIFRAGLSDFEMEIDSYQALDTLKLAARKAGLLLSPSSAANLLGALKLAEKINEGVIVTVFPDDSAKYGEVYQQVFAA